MKCIGKSAMSGDFLDGETRVCELVGCNPKAPLVKILGWGSAAAIPEQLEEMLP